MSIAIIPARAGSKGIPMKNIKKLKGKELIVYTVEAAINSGVFKKICITTDCEEVVSLFENYESIDIVRLPSSLTKDDSMMIDVVLFVLDYYKNKNIFFETSILLQPTSPLRDNFHIKEALSLYYKNNYNSLVSFSEIRDHPYKSFYLLENNKIKPLFGIENVSKPRHLLPKIIKQNGAIYINKVSDLYKSKSFFNFPVYPFIMDDYQSIDIDKEIDFKLAEIYLNN